MNRINQLFQTKKNNILSIYFTAGYPALNDTMPLIHTLEEAGVDMIELGIPYSDPLADGPTIQKSGQKAIKNGMTLPILFDQIKDLRKSVQIPVILMGHFNQVLQYGEVNFFKKCKEVGVDGLILPDLPLYEYEKKYKAILEELNLNITFLFSPQTGNERLKTIDANSKGFAYMVSSAATTGAKKGISADQEIYFDRINKMGLKSPRLIGFGISDKQSFQTACSHANGVIIGSAFIKAITDVDDIQQAAKDFVVRILK